MSAGLFSALIVISISFIPGQMLFHFLVRGPFGSGEMIWEWEWIFDRAVKSSGELPKGPTLNSAYPSFSIGTWQAFSIPFIKNLWIRELLLSTDCVCRCVWLNFKPTRQVRWAKNLNSCNVFEHCWVREGDETLQDVISFNE